MITAESILKAALEVPKAQMSQSEPIIVCDFCEEEVRTVGEDSIYWCDEHGIVEAYWHEEVV